jgi:hypothetical protein
MGGTGAIEAEPCAGPATQAGPEDWRKPMPKEARVALLLAAAACLMAVTVEWVIAELNEPPK